MPGYLKDFHFVVRNAKNNKVMACIMGVPKKLSVGGQVMKVCEVNFLAVHKKLREKRVAQVCIQEMMRRKRKHGFMQAFYTSGHSMPTPFTTVHYMNRFIDCERLVDCLYTHIPQDSTIDKMKKQFRLPPKQSIKLQGTARPMEKKDLPAVYKLYKAQVERYKLYFKYSQDDVMHLLLPKDDIVWTYVVDGVGAEDKSTVTDFISMYRLTQSTTSMEAQAKGISQMHSGGIYFYGLTVNSLEDMVKLALHYAKDDMECDALSAMTIMDNKPDLFEGKLGFVAGDGALHYYLVNWSLGD